MKTIAQQINWDFEANGNLEIKNKNGEEVYFENAHHYWRKWEYTTDGYAHFENSSGSKRTFQQLNETNL